ncbi:glutathione S-transferase family protein [Neptunomonas marina]|uniref:Glutathione S-transferase family protein n=1 Tax=Neptunomonas marina TaxID=1815562 RepID=A0A437Q657_9GAMM|nr:glutathione S-transferase family protein [Neptunomonas marina]RVU29998.1 glutathione S-transferase family protein [Neptunomonas marina]
MQLVGSIPSPYVRRTRMLLEGRDYTFTALDIYSPEGRVALEKFTPAMKIPVLVDGEQTLFDSRVIYRYLTDKLALPALSWEQENTMTLIDAANDAFVIKMMVMRSGIETTDETLVTRLQDERLQQVLPLLETAVQEGQFAQWDYLAICLYCLLDWCDFRNLFVLADYPALQAFRDQHQSREIAVATDPRQA